MTNKTLLEKYPYEFLSGEETLTHLPCDQLVIDEIFNSRVAPTEPPTELVESIRVSGVATPICVSPVRHLTTKKEFLLVIAGRNRLKACLKLGLKTIPAQIKILDLISAHRISIDENLQRVDLTFWDLACKMDMFHYDFKYKIKQIADTFGKSENSIKEHLNVFLLCEGVQKLVKQNHFGNNIALKIKLLLRISDEDQQLKIANVMVAEKWSAKQLNETIDMFFLKQEAKQKTRKKREPTDDIFLSSDSIDITKVTKAFEEIQDQIIILEEEPVLDVPDKYKNTVQLAYYQGQYALLKQLFTIK